MPSLTRVALVLDSSCSFVLGFGAHCLLLLLQLQNPDQNQACNPQEKQPDENPVVLGQTDPQPAKLLLGPFGPVKKKGKRFID